MRAVITVIGKDRIGIIAGISVVLADAGVNILDISQTTMQDFFTMIMLTGISKCELEFGKLSEKLQQKGSEMDMTVKIQHEDLFNSMHRI